MTWLLAERVAKRGVVGLLLGCLAGCGNDPVGPFQDLTNETDDFRIAAAGLTNLTLSAAYEWRNTGQWAVLTHSTVTGSGTAVVTLRDAFGTEVLHELLAPGVTAASRPGSAGRWRITVTLTDFSGTLSLRITSHKVSWQLRSTGGR
jgi:hypothetical protein